jgi:hypothetical protein
MDWSNRHEAAVKSMGNLYQLPCAAFNNRSQAPKLPVVVEWAFAPHWSVKGEYIQVDLGSSNTTIFDPANNCRPMCGAQSRYSLASRGSPTAAGGKMRSYIARASRIRRARSRSDFGINRTILPT